MKKINFIQIFLAVNLLFIATVSIEGFEPAYALTSTDTYIVDNDYELLSDDTYTVGTLDSYYQIWIKPSDCYPIDVGTPPCTGAFGVEYNEDSDSDQYDQNFYDAVRNSWLFLDPSLTDITDDVPGAGLALLYSVIPEAYVAIAYFGEKTGVFIIVAEVTIATVSSNCDASINAEYDAAGIKDVMVNIGEKVSDELNLPGFTGITVIGSLILLTATAYFIKRKRK